MVSNIVDSLPVTIFNLSKPVNLAKHLYLIIIESVLNAMTFILGALTA